MTLRDIFVDLLGSLERIEHEIDQEIGSRVIRDSHDYSSSAYSGYDDGFNSGVGEATEMFRDRVEKFLAERLAARR